MYTCLHQYLRALLFYTVVSAQSPTALSGVRQLLPPQCLTTPTVAISAIMVAGYKKFILVSLLKFGKVSIKTSNPLPPIPYRLSFR